MFFQKKGKLRKEYDDKLIVLLKKVKNEWLRQKRMVEQSVEPSQDVICSLKIAEAKYFFLLKEAKRRPVKMEQW
ncbi:YaaL family protein [Bacillus thuringiensis]|nr:YaaL family protein [Bacillus thuringiensis]MED2759051.1 YaaL family protein [Bacillus thuringiensis]MED2771287.1 YaaL family protein [Bacillus thuringiensis]MED2776004.1 YaaL family protein [Bacillus thuringiensis]MED2782830.1 YaaL family protein [Bacillus thuringiensis]